MNTLAKPEFPPVYNAKRGNGMNAWIKHFSEEEDKMLNLKNRVDEFRSKVAEQVIKRKHGGYVEADFTIFPTVEMTKVKSIYYLSSFNLVQLTIPNFAE